MNLFSELKEQTLKNSSPLAEKMRPTSIEDIFGQEHILGPKKLLRRSIEQDQIMSIIFYGPSGTGKTTLAHVIANTTKSKFENLNAVISNISDIREIIKKSEENMALYQQKTIVFIDEIHRFTKTQQDALLPYVEKGNITLIGATTENPFFSINQALLSRSLIFELKPLSVNNIMSILKRALLDRDRGLGNYKVSVDDDFFTFLAESSSGDVRLALNALELAVKSTEPNKDGIRLLDIKVAEDSIQKPILKYDKSGDNHYNVTSAFIKSMRGSDPNATLHYLARMFEAGEDPRFIARRILVHAAEDVGLADPNALVVAQSAAKAFESLGMPEGRLVLAEAALYIALAPKSNSVLVGIDSAISDIRKGNYSEVPLHLHDTHYSGAKSLDKGKGYKYPHSYPNNYVEQDYLPDKLKNEKYYKSSKNGWEKDK